MTISIAALISLAILMVFGYGCCTPQSTYTISKRADGGYSVHIRNVKRIWMPVTSEGPFPIQDISGTIEIIGPGKDLRYRNQDGYYYPLTSVSSKTDDWDYGYTWVDAKRKHLYLNP
jgi:hypothetical protein